MRSNKKYIAKMVYDRAIRNGEINKDFINRQLGQTTADAYGYISKAMSDPNVPYRIRDHYDVEVHKSGGCRMASVGLFEKIRELIEHNNLKYFKMDITSLSICYEGVIELEEIVIPSTIIYRVK